MAADGAELPGSSCKALPERDGTPLLGLWLLGSRGSRTCPKGRGVGASGSPSVGSRTGWRL